MIYTYVYEICQNRVRRLIAEISNIPLNVFALHINWKILSHKA